MNVNADPSHPHTVTDSGARPDTTTDPAPPAAISRGDPATGDDPTDFTRVDGDTTCAAPDRTNRVRPNDVRSVRPTTRTTAPAGTGTTTSKDATSLRGRTSPVSAGTRTTDSH
jgi:hypothetical protein